MVRLTRWSGAAVGLASSLLISLFLFLEVLLPQIEHVVVDQMMRWRGPLDASAEVVVCAIDGDSLQQRGRWPWPRHLLAELVDRLQADGAGVVALDFTFSETTDEDEDAELAAALGEPDNVVLGFHFSDSPTEGTPTSLRSVAFSAERGRWKSIPEPPGVYENVEALAAAARSQGFVNTPLDHGVVRHAPAVWSFDGRYYPSLPLSAVRRFRDARDLELSPAAGGWYPEIRFAEQRVPISPEGLLWINYRGGAGTFATYPAHEVLAGTTEQGAFEGRLVFVGVTVPDVREGDAYQTPFPGLTAGVEIHATVADNILRGDYLRDNGIFEVAVSGVALLVLGPLVGFCAGSFAKRLTGASVAALLLLAWAGSCYLAFRWLDTHLQLAAPLLAGGLALVVTLFQQVHDVERQLAETLTAKANARAGQLERLMGGRSEVTLALVLTEVVGSTAAVSEDQDPGVIRQAHFAQARSLLEAHGGEEIDTLSDWFLAVFATAAESLDYALGLWRNTGHELVRIRGGVHLGQISFRADEPFGNNLNFLARLAMRPEGPEIWTSERVKQEVDDNQVPRYANHPWRQRTTRLPGFRGRRTLWILAADLAVEEPVPEAVRVGSEFDVFLSYNSKDAPDVEELRRELESRGVQVWMDSQRMLPGENWQRSLQEAIQAAPAAAILIGEHGLGPWSAVEMETFLITTIENGMPIVPVLLPGAPEKVDLPFLDRYLRIDLRDGFNDDEELDRLAESIIARRPVAPAPTPAR